MIYGLNFNGTPIPESIRKRFRRETPIPVCRRCWLDIILCVCQQGPWRGAQARLVGVGQSEEEKDAMIVQAYNGRRKLYVLKRHTATGDLFGVYAF